MAIRHCRHLCKEGVRVSATGCQRVCQKQLSFQDATEAVTSVTSTPSFSRRRKRWRTVESRRRWSKKSCPELVVGFMFAQHMVSHDKNRMANGDNGTPFAATGSQTLVLSPQVGLFGTRSRPSRLAERRTQIAVALSNLARLPFARTFMVARCNTSPSGQMFVGWEATHVNADLRHQHFSRRSRSMPGMVSSNLIACA